MKTLFVLASVIVGLCLSLLIKVDAQKRTPSQRKPTPKQVGTVNTSQAATPQQIASTTVDAVKRYRPMEPYVALTFRLADSERELLNASMNRALDTVESVSGESFGGTEKLQLIMVYRGWVLSRTKRPLTAEALEQYEARFKLIDSGILKSWQEAKAKLDIGPDQPTLLILAIGFHNDLWNGVAWRQGNPTQAIERLQSITPEAIGSLADAVGLSSALRFVAAFALLDVDSLFAKNVFQPARFESALPLARQMLTK